MVAVTSAVSLEPQNKMSLLSLFPFLFAMVALHRMTHSFIEFRKPLHHDKAVIHEGEGHCVESIN